MSQADNRVREIKKKRQSVRENIDIDRYMNNKPPTNIHKHYLRAAKNSRKNERDGKEKTDRENSWIDI